MGLFLVLILVPMMIQHLTVSGYRISYHKRNERALFIFFLFLTILLMFRHESVGTDTSTYMLLFEQAGRFSFRKLDRMSLEMGYAVFTKIITVFFQEPQVLLIITAIIVNGMIYPTYKRLCADATLTIVLFCTISTFFMMFSGIRQMIAIGIGFRAYEFVRSKKKISFVLMVCLAMTFHTSAFLLFFMYPVYHIKVTKKWLLIVVPVLTGIFIFNKPIFMYLSLIMARYTRFEGGISSTGAYAVLILLILFAVFAFLIPEEANLDEEVIGLRNFLLFSLVLQMFAPLHTLAMRMNYYYIIFIPILIPLVIKHRNKRWKQVAEVSRHVMVVFFLVYFFYNAYGGETLDVFPYHFFWENV